MDKIATEEVVWKTCELLAAEGRKATGRSVQAEVGGSLSTIYTYIGTWKARDSSFLAIADNIPSAVLESISRALRQNTLDVTNKLRIASEESAERENEVVQALAAYESLLATSKVDLFTARAQIVEVQQTRDKESAVVAETISGLREVIAKLEQEKLQLMQDGEAARVELVKVQSELDRADKATLKTDANVLVLEKQVKELSRSTVEALRDKAVADRYAQDLVDQVLKLEKLLENADTKIVALESERANQTHALSTAESARLKAEGIADQVLKQLENTGAKIAELDSERAHLTHELSAAKSARFRVEGIGEQLQLRLLEKAAQIDLLNQELSSWKLSARKQVTGEDDTQA